jgi:hypothetical protein
MDIVTDTLRSVGGVLGQVEDRGVQQMIETCFVEAETLIQGSSRSIWMGHD